MTDDDTLAAFEQNAERINAVDGLDPAHKVLIQMVRELVAWHRKLAQNRLRMICDCNEIVHRSKHLTADELRAKLNNVIGVATGNDSYDEETVDGTQHQRS